NRSPLGSQPCTLTLFGRADPAVSDCSPNLLLGHQPRLHPTKATTPTMRKATPSALRTQSRLKAPNTKLPRPRTTKTAQYQRKYDDPVECFTDSNCEAKASNL